MKISLETMLLIFFAQNIECAQNIDCGNRLTHIPENPVLLYKSGVLGGIVSVMNLLTVELANLSEVFLKIFQTASGTWTIYHN